MQVQRTEKGRHYYFLQGGGELGELTRNYDWESTPVGGPEEWPECLKVTVAMILASKFPMFLWWGPEMIQFYNDAYRPSLGNNGKHPHALGQRAIDCWPEIWPIIYPLIKQVQDTGEACWNEDMLVPIYRNGKIEDVYWTFGYSAIRGSEGNVEGVLVVCHETTEKVQMVRQLAHSGRKIEISERNLRNTILQAPVAMCILRGRKYVVELANEKMFELWGKSGDDMRGRPLFEGLPEAMGQGFDVLLEGVLCTGETVQATEVPVILPRRGGSATVYVNFVYEAYREPDNTISGILVVANDVTPQVETRRKIEESEFRYRTLIEEATIATGLYTGEEIRIQYANKILLGYWGKNESVIGKPMAEAIPELKGQPFLGLLRNVFLTGETYTGTEEKAYLEVDGELRPFYFNYIYKALRDKEGNIYAIHHTALDVTSQVLSKMALENNERNFRQIVRQAPVGICIADADTFEIRIANESFAAISSGDGDNLAGNTLWNALPAMRNNLEPVIKKTVSTGESQKLREVPLRLKRNNREETVHVNFSIEPMKDAEGLLKVVMLLAVEVTLHVKERHQIEQLVANRTKELAEANELLKQSNAELAQYAYIASHDLQEPIRKISTFTQMLQRSLGTVNPRAENYFQKINNSTRRMIKLVRDILSYSQLSDLNKDYKVVDLNELMREVQNDFELLLEEKQAKLVCGSLPRIEAIQPQMVQLFSNLLSNSLKFVKDGVQPRITITAEALPNAEAQKLNLFVPGTTIYKLIFSDNGIGFAEEYAEQIFNIFQRLHGKTDYSGTGIGLSICRKIAQNHGGDINAKGSRPGEAVFNVFLPATQKKS